ncbi:MAG: NAD(P)-dependent oxidoreductase [Alphaproteobacteria bacterium]|nr:NAD(P)-dependent oxidoreductase [Alphaproteobacteria bacterium]
MGLRPHVSNGAGLSRDQIEENFADLTPTLNHTQAHVEAARCLYCYDAPCIKACPTAIDIPTFIHQIRSDNLKGSAHTILKSNIMGGTCGRACPTEILCEEACVLNARGEEPVKIGALQRHAVEDLMARGGAHPFARAPRSGKTMAVIGAGPAGLSFAHRAAMLGHDVVVFEARPKPGGLNEYGLAAYKMANDFAQREIQFLLGIGGIRIEYGNALGAGVTLDTLRKSHAAVFIGIGIGKTNRLGIPGEDLDGVRDALDWINDLRQVKDKSTVPVGKNVVVIGGGNTAIDAAVQAKRLGAINVVMAYRRGEENMSATEWVRDLARTNGVVLRTQMVPSRIEGEGRVTAVYFGEERVPADMVLKAIGQKLDASALGALAVEGGKIAVDADFQTMIPGVYAGGDAVKSGEDLTVQAVEDGKRAAIAADRHVRGA